MNEYQYHIEVLKQKIECDSREAWKYESLNEDKHPFYKNLFHKFFSGQMTIDKRKHLENELES